MTLGIMQPYFMPYIGYWQLMAAVDTYVVYDDVNYIKRGWINRNNILINGEKKLFTISLREASQNKLINEIYVVDDFSKLRRTIQLAYKKAPYYDNVIRLLDEIFDYDNKNLALFIFNSIKKVCNYLRIKTRILLSSSIEKNNNLKGQDKILDICKSLKADCYINAIGGQDLYNKEVFASNNILLNFLSSDIVEYEQFNNNFVGGLSIIDIMMFNSPEQIRQMLTKFNLV